MPLDLLGEIHSSNSVSSGDWASFRAEVTGMYLLSGSAEWNSQHLIREYNRQVNSRYKAWTGSAPVTTGLFIDPYNDGFSYEGTGDFRNYP
jgi:hypothetical protein